MDSRNDIDFEKMIEDNTPQKLKNEIDFLAWMNIFFSPLAKMYNDFLRFCDATIYDLLLTGQVCSLERLLNDKYDFTSRRIYIKDAVIQTPIYLYQDVENKDVDLYTDAENNAVSLFTDSETNGQTSNHFIVFVPVIIPFDATEMRSVIMQKRLVGKRFKIQTF
jgi:hypothetical protein